MHVRFSDTAEADLDNIRDYLEPRNAAAFQRILTGIITAAYQLADFPFLGRVGRVEETRELSVPRTPFIIVYWLADEYHIEILNILHDRQQWPPGK